MTIYCITQNINNKSLLPNVRLRLKSGSTLSSPVNNNVAATHNNDTNKLSQFQLKDPSRTILMRVEELTAFQLQEKEEKKKRRNLTSIRILQTSSMQSLLSRDKVWSALTSDSKLGGDIFCKQIRASSRLC